MRALCLLSGGLDSILAARIVLDLGIEVEALHFVTAFCTCTPKSFGCSAAVSAARQLGITVRTTNNTEELLEILRAPPHGYGRYMNPCIDCRIAMFRRAHRYMDKVGAAFVVTGEVLGERPMSQRLDAMRLIELEAGLDGLIVRPLSARMLPESLPERKGWVDRSRLLALRGRSRKAQLELARSFGIKDYPCPAGGCRLTDPGFAGRMKDLLDHPAEISRRDVVLLRWGRHFRLSPKVKLLLGRNERENAKLLGLRAGEDGIVNPVRAPGPTGLIVGEFTDEEIAAACSVASTYTDGDIERGFGELNVEASGNRSYCIRVRPLPRDSLERLRIKPLQRGWRRNINVKSA